jgi:glycogen debranching enzyme
VFQVRGVARSIQGQHYQPVTTDGSICFNYRGRDNVMRQTLVEMSPKPDEIDARVGRWRLRLEPSKQIHIEVHITPKSDLAPARASNYNLQANLQQRRHAFAEWERRSTRFKTNNEVFDAALNTGVGDFHALQVPIGNEHIIAAGIPWFATPFGRDSIIAAYQSLSLNPQLAVETLRVLARYQGKQDNAWQDEEPGKILHEYREGEMTLCGEMPFGPYYGSVDATPLFLILLSETYNWTADENLVRELLPAANRALEWIDRYGDKDGDGFTEYQRRSPKGLINQGW